MPIVLEKAKPKTYKFVTGGYLTAHYRTIYSQLGSRGCGVHAARLAHSAKQTKLRSTITGERGEVWKRDSHAHHHPCSAHR